MNLPLFNLPLFIRNVILVYLLMLYPIRQCVLEIKNLKINQTFILLLNSLQPILGYSRMHVLTKLKVMYILFNMVSDLKNEILFLL